MTGKPEGDNRHLGFRIADNSGVDAEKRVYRS
jgi:hypothetical protein